MLEFPSMEPSEFDRVELVDRVPRNPTGFAGISQFTLRNIYRGGREPSASYAFEVVETRYSDAVVVVLYHRCRDGTVQVGLREGLRPAVFLRSLVVPETPAGAESPIVIEAVAGGLENQENSADSIRMRAAEEVREESGFLVSPADFVDMGAAVYSTPAFAIEKLHYLCVEVEPGSRQPALGDSHPLEEVQHTYFVGLSEALSWCRSGKIKDNKTEVALFRFASWYGVIPDYGIDMKKDAFPTLSDSQLNLVKGLFDRSWLSFDERRRHEYHLSYLVWATYTLFTAAAFGVVNKNSNAADLHFELVVKILTTVALLALALAHGSWIRGIARAQRRDMRVADFYGTAIRRNLKMEDLFEVTFPNRSGFVRWNDGESFWLKNYNHVAELIVTLALFAAATVVLWCRC
jgi:ADP-ribose pyrophosphatase